MSRRAFAAWGRLPALPAAQIMALDDRSAPLPASDAPMLAYGNGRSYGDVCQNPGGSLLLTKGLDRFISFDRQSGVLCCEAGVRLADILALIVPHGWFLPVTPGTRYVSVGGAIANDVHGKNHHRAGSFGCHLLAFELLRSDGTRRLCTPDDNADWFAASIGGLGLTGLITWAKIQLRKIDGRQIRLRQQRFHGLDDFFARNTAAEQQHEYVVAWVDCHAATPRGIIMAGDHASDDASSGKRPAKSDAAAPPAINIPLTPPLSLINRPGSRLFNQLYFHRRRPAELSCDYLPYFYPLDAIGGWNRLYGRRGFYQYQAALPSANAAPACAAMLAAIAASGEASFLAVLKNFGTRPSPGLLSFPCAGTTLALDFPQRGAATLRLFARLDAIVSAAGGRLYPAKDARMSGRMFRAAYPASERFTTFIDPRFSSGFWRRISGTD